MTDPHLPLDLWLLRQATVVALLAERRMLWPWRGQILDVAREIQRRAVEARQMRTQLDRVVGDAWIEAHDAAPDALAELSDVVGRWKRGGV